jgi:uncharacterized protein YcnI|tara:strand:+ start:7132 stop:7353 length:222 start_codon:yes stop_codon:yes gene_type:complete
MYKKYFELGKLGFEFFKKTKEYYRQGGKKTKDIMDESGVTKEIAKSDIKSDIKRRVFRGGKKPSDFYDKPKNR